MACSLRIIGTYLRGAAGGWEPLVACSLTLIGNYFRGAAGGLLLDAMPFLNGVILA